MLDPETGLLLFILGGIGCVASFTGYEAANQLGPAIEARDFLPMPPPYPPLPRFLYKAKAIEALKLKKSNVY